MSSASKHTSAALRREGVAATPFAKPRASVGAMSWRVPVRKMSGDGQLRPTSASQSGAHTSPAPGRVPDPQRAHSPPRARLAQRTRTPGTAGGTVAALGAERAGAPRPLHGASPPPAPGPLPHRPPRPSPPPFGALPREMRRGGSPREPALSPRCRHPPALARSLPVHPFFRPPSRQNQRPCWQNYLPSPTLIAIMMTSQSQDVFSWEWVMFCPLPFVWGTGSGAP
jgi:hypothetical protein